MLSSRAEVARKLHAGGYVLLSPAEAEHALHVNLLAMEALRPSWSDLAQDGYLRDGGHYRWRRHSCFAQHPGVDRLDQVPHRPHWQPTSYNALHGGLERWFEPMDPAVAGSAAFLGLLRSLGQLFAGLQPTSSWFIEAHQFRIDTDEGIGRPTPEGAHRDGVDFVAVILIDRRHVRGGETRVFDSKGSSGTRFTMQQPWTMLLLDDARVVHETTPIQPDGSHGVRDTLVLTYRADGFQAPEAGAGAELVAKSR